MSENISEPESRERMAELEARAVAAEAALREAQKFASDLADKYHFDYKRGDKRGDSYTEGKSDAADEIAQKLAALAPQAEPQAPPAWRCFTCDGTKETCDCEPCTWGPEAEVVKSATPSPLRAVYETPEFKAEWEKAQAPTDRREQAISFAHGNVSLGNPAVTREMVAEQYDKLHPAEGSEGK